MKKLLKKFLIMTLIFTLAFTGVIPAYADTAAEPAADASQTESYNYYFGVPHAHTSWSDALNTSTPADAYEHGKGVNLDYLFVTDHSNMFNGNEFGEYDAEKNEFAEKEGSEWTLTRQLAEAATTESFLAGRGFEMTSSASNGGENYGHINVYNTDTYVEAASTMQKLSDFYDWLDRTDGAIAYFNHPNRPESSFEYLNYVEKVDDNIQMIEVGNGSMGSNYLESEEYYYKALDYGWHLAPTNGQDNHALNWGDADNLTAVIAEELTEEAFYEAMQARRVYSTETRNLRLEVSANGQMMGSILDVEKGGNIHFEIKASDPEDKIEKIEIITNGGKTIAETTLETPAYEAEFTTDITVGAGKNWYVVKVTHEGGREGIGSANYAHVSNEDIKLANLNIASEFVTLNSETEVSVQVTNAGTETWTGGAEVNFYYNNELVSSHPVTDSMEPGVLTTVTSRFTPAETGSGEIRAELVCAAEGSVKELKRDVTIIVPNGKNVLFDNSHKNIGVVNGTMLEFSEVLRLFGYNVTFNTGEITAEVLKDVDVLILNTPTKDSAGAPSNKLTETEEAAVVEFVRNGGGMLYGTQSYDQSNYDATQYNSLLEKMGSGIRFNFDSVHEGLAEHQENGKVQSFYVKNFPESTLGINDDMYALRIYRGGSLVNAEGTALVNDAEAGLEILATGNQTSYTGKLGEGGYAYVPQGTEHGDGTAIPMVAAQTIGKGSIVVTGRYAYSNYEIGNDASNGAFFLKAVDYLADLDNYTSLDRIASLEEGTTVSAAGTVIQADSGVFWIRDNTGSTIAVRGAQTGSLPLTEGTRVLVNGKVTVTGGEKAIEFQSYTHQVQYIGAADKVPAETADTIYKGFYNSTAELDAQLIARYNSGAFSPDGGSAEIVVYNSARKTAYAVNGMKGTLDQIPMNSLSSAEKSSGLQTLTGREINVKALVEGKDADFTYGDMTSVAVSPDGSLVAAALQDADYTKNGRAVLFSCSKDGSLTFKSMTETGVQPDMITFTDDGSLVLTANEGEPRQGYSAEGAVDPEGTVTIINVKDGSGETVGFGDFDGQRESLTQAGVVIKKETSPSVDFEPEYITAEGSTAYVSLQEANAVAVLDLNKKAFTGVYSIGFEDYSKTAIDLNSKDGKYEAATYDNIMGIRMPDAISAFTVGSKTYLVTANEGDSRAWPVETEADVNEIKDKKSPVTGQKFEGKVTWFDVSQYDGLKEGTDYLFGGRSFSVLEVTESGLKAVYSSGNDFEKITAEVLPEYFNCSNDTIELEDRTGKKGPEPEGITTGIVDGKTYAFIALERIGGIMMYDVTNPSKTEFVNYINSRDFSQDVKDDVSPEGMAFVAAEKSSTGNALLVAANEVSGTVSVYELTAEAKVTPPSWTPSYTPDVPAVPDVPDVPDEEDELAEHIKAVRFSAKSRLTTLHGKRAVKVYWNAPEEVKLDGYQVFRSVKRYSGFTKKPFFTTSNTCYWNTKDLKAGTRYYYKVRGFKEIDGERVYTQWSTKAWRTV